MDEETGELMFGEAPDYENPADAASTDPESGAGDNEYVVVVGGKERRGREGAERGEGDPGACE